MIKHFGHECFSPTVGVDSHRTEVARAMSMPESDRAQYDRLLDMQSVSTDKQPRMELHRFAKLLTTGLAITALSLVVSCSTVSNFLTHNESENRRDTESVTGGKRIPLPPGVEEFEPNTDSE